MLVKFFMMKRGRYNRPFLHVATLGVLGAGVLVGPYLSETFPVFGQTASIAHVPTPAAKESVTTDDTVFQTNVTDKNRTGIIAYKVQPGDTVSTIAQKFGISSDTVRWANNLNSDDLTVGDELQILPVTGVQHKVQEGETVYSIAKLYNANPQEIVDWPYNQFANPETFSLIQGQMLIVPDGVMPSAQSTPTPKPRYIADSQNTSGEQSQGGSVPYSGGFMWPVHGEITTPFSSWHPGIDIAGSIGTPIYAATSGTVLEASCGWNWGYGCTVLLKSPGGFETRYGHMNTMPFVHVGQTVSGGQEIGVRGSTGRSTGPHLHFEIHAPSGAAVNPFNYLP